MTQYGTAAFRRPAARLESKAAKCIPTEHLGKAGISELRPRIKVLLVSADPLVLEGIKSYLQGKHTVGIVGEAASDLEAVAKTQKLKPDVLVMDIPPIPIVNHLEGIRRLLQTCPDVKVLVLSVCANREVIGQIVQSGAHAYVPKNASPAELTRAIESLHRGKVVFPPDVVDTFFADFVQSKGRSIKPRPQRISDRERQVLHLIVDGLSSKEIAPRLHISTRTVQKHRENIMEKLGVRKATELVKVAISQCLVGYSAYVFCSIDILRHFSQCGTHFTVLCHP